MASKRFGAVNPWAPDADPKPSGSDPVVGQRGKPYNNENARGQNQPRTNSDTTAGDSPASGPKHSGWPVRPASQKY